MKTLKLAVIAAALAAPLAAQTPEQSFLSAQTSAAGILDEARRASGVGTVLSTLYQRLFTLQDQRQRIALETSTLDRGITNLIKYFRNIESKWDVYAKNEFVKKLLAKNDADWVVALREEYSSVATLNEISKRISKRDQLDLEAVFVERNIQDVEAKIKSLLERLVEEERR